MRLRPATDADKGLFFDWKNDPEAVKYSLLQVAVTPEEHDRWWATTQDRRYILESHEEEPIAIARLGIVDTEAEVSIIVDPRRRGVGYGTGTLWGVRNEAVRLGMKKLVARIVPLNTVSLRTFLGAGYVVTAVKAAGPIHLVLECEL